MATFFKTDDSWAGCSLAEGSGRWMMSSLDGLNKVNEFHNSR